MKWASAISYAGWLPSGILYLHGPGSGTSSRLHAAHWVNRRPLADQKRTRHALIHADQAPGLIVGSAGSDDDRRGAGSGVNELRAARSWPPYLRRSPRKVLDQAGREVLDGGPDPGSRGSSRRFRWDDGGMTLTVDFAAIPD